MTTTEISKMSVPEKLQLMDALWEDLRSKPEQIDSPNWHGKELENTKARREMGLEKPMTLEEAKERLFLKRHDS